jgi:hypothetical protein
MPVVARSLDRGARLQRFAIVHHGHMVRLAEARPLRHDRVGATSALGLRSEGAWTAVEKDGLI